MQVYVNKRLSWYSSQSCGKKIPTVKPKSQFTRIFLSKTPPSSPGSSEDFPPDSSEPNIHNDPVLKKMHYIDPGTMSYKRATFESLFYKSSSPLTGPELKTLSKGKKMKLSVQDRAIVLHIYAIQWDDINGHVWDSMAELLSDWTCEGLIREVLPVIATNESMFEGKEFLIIPLKVTHNPPSYE